MPEPSSNDSEKFKPGTFGCHEALHLTSILAEAVDEHLCQHRAVMSNPAWEELAQKACDALHELYLSIGAAHMEAQSSDAERLEAAIALLGKIADCALDPHPNAVEQCQEIGKLVKDFLFPNGAPHARR